MPLINFTTAKLTKEQKAELIKGFTELSMRITGAPEHVHTVLIHELDTDAIGLGTKSLEEVLKSQG